MVLVHVPSHASRPAATALAVALLLVPACKAQAIGAGANNSGGDTSADDPTAGDSTTATDTAPPFNGTITITAPESGEIINTDTLSVEVSVENFSLSEADIGAANVDDEGHWVATVDGTAAGSSGTSTLDIDLATVMELITISEHELAVQLVPNDGDVTAFPTARAIATFYYCACCPNCSG